MTSHYYHQLLLSNLYAEDLAAFAKSKNTVKFKILTDYCATKCQVAAVPHKLNLGNHSLSHLVLFNVRPGDSKLKTSVFDSTITAVTGFWIGENEDKIALSF
jgi:hypothetical protein